MRDRLERHIGMETDQYPHRQLDKIQGRTVSVSLHSYVVARLSLVLTLTDDNLHFATILIRTCPSVIRYVIIGFQIVPRAN